MILTDYQAQFFAYELTRRCSSDSAEKLAGAVAGAQVDLNPHQVDAALFAFHSPLSKGALLADEVGLGKTIEAGLVISQKWAERKRRILIITLSNLRKQWHQELAEKFFLPATILESKSYNAAIRAGRFRPFETKDSIVICSYQFARNKASDIHALPWDIVVIDEAHRLRNVYKPSNIIANVLKQALVEKHKLLLTATPLQNSLLELFGLVSFIDEHAFGDLKSFREQFANLNQEQIFQTLKERLKSICHRTLRRQVTAYVPYTKRLPLVEEFTPEESEDRLYALVSDYLRRDNLMALPASQRSLMTLVLRKLLASSTFAIAGALNSIIQRLKTQLRREEPATSLEDELDADYEALDETAEEWGEEAGATPLSDADRAALAQEITDLEAFAALATSITSNAKGKALLKALEAGFARMAGMSPPAPQKAIIFTESKRTQSYLLRVLSGSPWASGIVLFNGSNTDDRSKEIYVRWLERHEGTDRVTGSRTADMRSALVDYFREEGTIMIATEAGAEGINLQFCSLAEAVLAQAKARELPVAEVAFSYGDHEGIISALEPLVGQSGWLSVSRFTVESLDQAEDHLIIAGVTDDGTPLDETAAARLLTVPERIVSDLTQSHEATKIPEQQNSLLRDFVASCEAQIQRSISERNAGFFDAEAAKLEAWSDDLKLGLEREIKELDRQIRESRREATTALTLETKLAAQKRIRALEGTRNEKRRSLFEAQDQVDRQRDELIAAIEGKLMQDISTRPLFTIRWRLV
ncbi:MAG: DEAD/DEAH box helicase family protein [Opitutaceae bacterium]|jgi:hypothetical protein|nr:DEAD/DEAH box helicase family protein [Opitutaceae bacterium]